MKNVDLPDVVICELGKQGDVFTDDLSAKCYICKKWIHFRPYVKAVKTKVCVDCGLELVSKNQWALELSEEQVAELSEYLGDGIERAD